MKKAFIPIMLVMFLVSCSRKDEQLAPSDILTHQFTIEAELPAIEQDSDVKGYFGSYVSARWSRGDAVSVINLTRGTVLGGMLVSSSEGNVTSFSGNVSGTIGKNDVLALFYPELGNTAEEQFKPFKYDLSSQSGTSSVNLLAYGTFTASDVSGVFSGKTIRFKYLLSYLKLNMDNLTPYSSVNNVVIKNVPSMMTVSINDQKDGFTPGTAEEKKSMERITINGNFHINDAGALYIPLAVMPSDSCVKRTVVVSVVNKGKFSSPLTSARFTENTYYNTIAGRFEHITTFGSDNFGTYMMDGTVLDEYDEYQDELCVGVEGKESDFSIENHTDRSYWTLKGIPDKYEEGDTLHIRFMSYGIAGIRSQEFPKARIVQAEQDEENDAEKLWIKADNYLFVVKK